MFPKRFRKLQVRTRPVKAIVLHSTVCRYPFPQLSVDKKAFQTNFITYGAILDGEDESIFHVVIDRIGTDYYPILLRPLQFPYTGFDFGQPLYDTAIQVCLIGDYNLTKPDQRLYEVVAYRVLSPLLFELEIPFTNIFLHSEIQQDSKCPGTFFDKNYLMNVLKKYRTR